MYIEAIFKHGHLDFADTITECDAKYLKMQLCNRIGIDGKSAYEIAVKNGFKGSEQEYGDYPITQGDYAKQAAQNAYNHAFAAQNAAQTAMQKAEVANAAADNANAKATFAQQQGNYAKVQGDYAKERAAQYLPVTVTGTAAAPTFTFTKSNFDAVVQAINNGAPIFVRFTDNRTVSNKPIDMSGVYHAVWNSVLSQIEVRDNNIATGFYLNGATPSSRGCVCERTTEAIAYGAKWNPTTGFFELNTLTDITYPQMVDILNIGYLRMIDSAPLNSQLNRTNLAVNNRGSAGGYSASLYGFAANNVVVEVCVLPDFVTDDCRVAFYRCFKLKTITGTISFIPTLLAANVFYMFLLCNSLESVNIKNCGVNLSFSNSPKLTRDSILYLINNRYGTNVITLTLHPTALANITPEDITLASSRNITIRA